MLVGIDPDFQERVDVRGATFTIRRLPYGKWERLRQQALEAATAARRRAIAALAARGEDPDAKPFPDVDVTAATVEVNRDPQYREAIAAVESEVVRWGVVGHEGFLKADGSPVPFETEAGTFEGEPVSLVGRATMRWYRANGVIVAALHNHLWRVNELGPAEKKA